MSIGGMVRGAGFEPAIPLLEIKDLGRDTQPTTQVLPEDLAKVVKCWAQLPESMRAGIVAMATACCGGSVQVGSKEAT